MMQLAQTLTNGIIIGAVYALLAVGFSLVYGVMRLVNFAHSGVFTIGSFATLVLVQHLGLSLIICIPLVALVGGVIGFTIERLAYRPVCSSPPIVALITSLALLAIIENLLAAIFGSDPIPLPQGVVQPYTLDGPFGIHITDIQIASIVIAFAMLAIVDFVVHRTRAGRDMRATAEDRILAATCGVDSNRVTSLAFVISGALGAVGGLLVALDVGCDPYLGTVVGLKAFAGCVLGSIHSVRGAVLGAFGVGIGENLVAGYISSEYKTALILSILALALLVFPNGLVARAPMRRT
jgi:branched-chain amino acid transport system permease protein